MTQIHLAQPWQKPRGIAAIFSSVDHQTIGLRYLVTGFLFFSVAGIEALYMRAQLSVPENTLLSPDVYSQFFSMHGMIMVLFFALPSLLGLGLILIPWLTGVQEMAYPGINAFGYWTFLFSGLFMTSSLWFGTAPSGGWLNPPSASTLQPSAGLNQDFWSLGLIVLGISTAAVAINFLATLLKRREPGISSQRMPLFAWAILVASFQALLVSILLVLANLLLVLEHKFNLHTFLSVSGNSSLVLRPLFSGIGQLVFFLILIPALGIACEIILSFSHRPVLGYSWMVFSILAMGVLGLLAGVGQAFTAGISPFTLNLSNLAWGISAIPGGILIAIWLATLMTGRPSWKTPLVWMSGFIILFTLASLAGILMTVPPLSGQLNNTFFDVAHFHSLLVGSAVFPLFAGLYYWFPKITGRQLHEQLGKVHFWLFFIGLLITFIPMYILGLQGMPREIYTYRPGTGWEGLNLIATMGGLVIVESLVIWVINLILSLTRGKVASDNPWESSSSEWSGSLSTSPGTLQAARGSLAPFFVAAALLAIILGVVLFT